MMRGLSLIMLGALVACGQDDEPAAARELYARITVGNGYRAWRRAPDFPFRKPSFTSHSREVEIFVDANMEQTLAGPGAVGQWPVGAIIVKESFSGGSKTLVAAMEKRADGWFWAEWDADGKSLYSGRPDVCVDCHDNRRGYSDWVYAIELPK